MITDQFSKGSLVRRVIKKVKERIVLREIHHRTTERHLPMGSQCCLPPDRGDRPDFTPTGQVGTRFIDPVRMKGWVGLVGWLHTEMVCYSTRGGHEWWEPSLSLALRDLDIWPQSWMTCVIAPWTTCDNWHQNSFSKYRVQNFGNRRMNEWTDWWMKKFTNEWMERSIM